MTAVAQPDVTGADAADRSDTETPRQRGLRLAWLISTPGFAAHEGREARQESREQGR